MGSNTQKKLLVKFVCIFECLLSQSLYGRLIENQKTGGSSELLPPENYFHTSSTKHFPIKHPDFGDPETNQRHGIQTCIFFHMIYIWTQYI